jgi:hypothetical protein
MAGSEKDRARSRRPSVVDRGWSSIGRVLDGQTIERLGDAVCGLHRAQGDEEHLFLGLTSKPWSTICQLFGLKTTLSCFPIWASNPAAAVL